MTEDKVRIGIIGGGRTGLPLIDEFMKYSYIGIKGVADLNPDTPGMKLAKENGIYTTTDAMDLVKLGEELDFLIEASGDKTLKKKIKDYYTKTGNKKTIIIHDLTARFLVSLCSKSNFLAKTFHPDDIGIGG